MKAISRFLFLATLVVGFGACGGGGIDIATDPPPPLPAQPQVTVEGKTKQLVFSWAAVGGAGHYRLMENPDGHSGFTQVGDNIPGGTLTVNRDIAVHLFDWVNAQHTVEACNVTGCSSSDIVIADDVMLDTIGYFKASDPSVRWLGIEIAMSENGSALAVVGKRANFDKEIYLFRSDGEAWYQEAPFENPWGPSFLYDWGDSIALSADGNVFVVGAPNWNADPGLVVVYRYSGMEWARETILEGSRDSYIVVDEGDYFGEVVALSPDGNTLAITASNAGTVYVYRFDGSSWHEQSVIEGLGLSLYFGADLALSSDGNTLAVGANADEIVYSNVGGEKGAVRVYNFDGTNWTQEAYLKSPGNDFGDNFYRVALSFDGHTLAVGASGDDSNATGMNGDPLDNSDSNSGAIYIYTRNGAGEWSQQAYIKQSDTWSQRGIGSYIALSSDGRTLVSSMADNSSTKGINGDWQDQNSESSGAVILFRSDGTNWSEDIYIKASNTDAGDGFGRVALSADGKTLAVGAVAEDSSATGINGDQDDNSAENSGGVYIY